MQYVEKRSVPKMYLWLFRALMIDLERTLWTAKVVGIDVQKPLLGQPPELVAELRQECLAFCPYEKPPEIEWPYRLDLERD